MIKHKKKSPEYAKYLQSQKWKDLRSLALIRAHNKCQDCGSEVMLCVHHLRYTWKYQDEPVTDLKVLCVSCHAKVHKRIKKWKQVKRVIIYNDGSIIEMTNTKPFFAQMRRDDKKLPWGERLIECITTPGRYDNRFPSDPE